MRAVRFTNRASLSLALLGISDTRPASQSTSPFQGSFLGLGLRSEINFLGRRCTCCTSRTKKFFHENVAI